MRTVKISMTADDDLAAWGPGAVEEEMEQHFSDYEFAAQVVGANIFDDADDVTVEVDFCRTLHVSAFATIFEDGDVIEDDIDMNDAYGFSERVWKEFCAN